MRSQQDASSQDKIGWHRPSPIIENVTSILCNVLQFPFVEVLTSFDRTAACVIYFRGLAGSALQNQLYRSRLRVLLQSQDRRSLSTWKSLGCSLYLETPQSDEPFLALARDWDGVKMGASYLSSYKKSFRQAVSNVPKSRLYGNFEFPSAQ
jgi:hypothetical protein